jgi:hypothetical protein
MLSKFRGAAWLLCACCTTLLLVIDAHGAAVQDSLILHNPENVTATVSRSQTSSTNFTMSIVFDAVPSNLGTIIVDPDLTAWSVGTPVENLTHVAVVDKHGYFGTIDRTVEFRALNSGMVGVTPSIKIQYFIRGEENWQNTIDVGQSAYSPGDPKHVTFRDNLGNTFDVGIQLSFSEGVVDSNGVFYLGCEDFEGYHIWRGVVYPDSIGDIAVIGEISKEEAFDQMFCDSLYFESILPALRSTGHYTYFPGLTCFENARDTEINLPLADNQFFWLDYNAFNGISYAYAVSTFDRGYNISSSRQGLQKTDSFIHCKADSIFSTRPCPELFKRVSVSVEPQNRLIKVYAVPNPYRSGSSVYTTPNYHNYPDDKIRFVNVPADCKLAVYTAAGDLVWETEHHSQTGNIEWDVKNESGQDVASGIYIYKLEDTGGGSVYGRLIVIR